MSIGICERVCVARISEKPSAQAACTPVDRSECITHALAQGIPLHQIERYLDWLELVQDCGMTRNRHSHTVRH
jgi:hypothetical protein